MMTLPDFSDHEDEFDAHQRFKEEIERLVDIGELSQADPVPHADPSLSTKTEEDTTYGCCNTGGGQPG